MYRVLMVEDSRFFGTVIKKRIQSELQAEVRWVQTLSETYELLNSMANDFFIALLDLNLPDAPNGEIVDLVIGKGIPVIIFTAEYSEEVRKYIWSKKNVADYVIKEGAPTIGYIVSLIRRIHRNRFIKVLVAEDSEPFRKMVCNLLRVHQYSVFEAADGSEALKIMAEHSDIRMVVSDFGMPYTDGIQLTKKIRKKHSREQVAIIGVSAQESMSVRFIKSGANDFIRKPFSSEEFYCRITQNIEMLEHIQKIKDLSNKDYLTALYNRRYFFEVGHKLFANAKRHNMNITVAMADIDFFKQINDNYGHDAGDEVLKRISLILKNRFRESDIVSRFGGEEFCILAMNSDPAQSFGLFETVRKTVESSETRVGDKSVRHTVSIGICTELTDCLTTMIRRADLMLYKAKQQGRNCVVSDR
ncbi:MAG: diguanylate cyclase response regulator [Desulfobacteraceae bacterium IS3]|nr:MAG: diguanylate cyclase response regulator [Desulfobacteraceae bacterium IS3]